MNFFVNLQKYSEYRVYHCCIEFKVMASLLQDELMIQDVSGAKACVLEMEAFLKGPRTEEQTALYRVLGSNPFMLSSRLSSL